MISLHVSLTYLCVFNAINDDYNMTEKFTTTKLTWRNITNGKMFMGKQDISMAVHWLTRKKVLWLFKINTF